ncbi:MAG: phosphate ABC transporter, permease protein PstA [Micrococcales bacterium]|nr:phosphate ABC transporter, permease protein PstA [Micrococcales bacterium]
MSTSTVRQRDPRSSASLAPVKGRRRFVDRAMRVVVFLAFLLAVIPLIWVLWITISRGIGLVVSLEWWTTSMRNIGPNDFGGGAAAAIQGTLIQAAIATAIAVPVGVLAGIYLVEYSDKPLVRPASFMTDVLTGIPSIVSGLFIYALFITTFGFNRMGFLVALALTLLMIPVVVRGTEEMLRIVPNELREASYALGVPRYRTILKVVLPTAISGIITSVMLAVARIMGETAPLLILVGYTASLNPNPFEGEQAALPLMINVERGNPLPPGQERAWAAALTLILLVMLLNIGARVISRFSGIKK